ncbi:hypothetical protein ABPG72_021433 [Tetrahymena utriculariae]
MNFYILLISLLIGLSVINAECLGGEIYELLAKKCLLCLTNCSDCYNINQDQCTSCAPNFLQSKSNTSTCVQKCELGEIQTQNQQYIFCKVDGCTKCDSKQNCLESSINLILDKVNNKCDLEQNACNSESEFIYSPFTLNQCVQSLVKFLW